MSNEQPDNLPIAVGQPGELVISVTREGLLVDGDPVSVAGYIDRIKSAAGQLSMSRVAWNFGDDPL